MSTNQILANNDNQNVMSVLFNNGPTQAGVMVGIVNAISQPFSQSSVLKALNLTDWAESLPLLIAIVVSFMLAIYQTLVMQKTRITESLIVVPLVTGILFGMSLGANHLTANMIESTNASSVSPLNDSTAQLRLQLHKQLDELQKQVELLDETSTEVTVISTQKTRGIPGVVGLQAATEKKSQADVESVNVSETFSDKKIVDKKKIKQQIEELRRKMQALEKQKRKPQPSSLYRSW